jgi:hypothetical protein
LSEMHPIPHGPGAYSQDIGSGARAIGVAWTADRGDHRSKAGAELLARGERRALGSEGACRALLGRGRELRGGWQDAVAIRSDMGSGWPRPASALRQRLHLRQARGVNFLPVNKANGTASVA